MPHRIPSNKSSYRDIPFLKRYFKDYDKQVEYLKQQPEMKEDEKDNDK